MAPSVKSFILSTLLTVMTLGLMGCVSGFNKPAHNVERQGEDLKAFQREIKNLMNNLTSQEKKSLEPVMSNIKQLFDNVTTIMNDYNNYCNLIDNGLISKYKKDIVPQLEGQKIISYKGVQNIINKLKPVMGEVTQKANEHYEYIHLRLPLVKSTMASIERAFNSISNPALKQETQNILRKFNAWLESVKLTADKVHESWEKDIPTLGKYQERAKEYESLLRSKKLNLVNKLNEQLSVLLGERDVRVGNSMHGLLWLNADNFKDGDLEAVIEDIIEKIQFSEWPRIDAEDFLDGFGFQKFFKPEADLKKKIDNNIEKVKEIIRSTLLDETLGYHVFFMEKESILETLQAETKLALMSSIQQAETKTPHSLSDTITMRHARIGQTGQLDMRGFKMNGVDQGAQSLIDLPSTLFVQLKGNMKTSEKSTDVMLGSVAYRMGSTVIGLVQAYSNDGMGFGSKGSQLESSLAISQSFGNIAGAPLFAEAQIGAISAKDVNQTNWAGQRTQLTLGMDTSYLTPFVQLNHRAFKNDTDVLSSEYGAYVGCELDVHNYKTSTFTLNTRLLGKMGYQSTSYQLNTHGYSIDLDPQAQWTGFIEYTLGLKSYNGLSFDTSLNISSRDTSLKLGFGVER